jgi:hypothetical protein
MRTSWTSQTPAPLPLNSPFQRSPQSPLQSPVQRPSTSSGATTYSPQPTGDVTLSESQKNTVLLTSGSGNTLRIFGDPHVEAIIDGKRETFNIGKGPGSIQLASGVKVEWDTKGKFGGLSKFQVTRPDGTSSVDVNPNDSNFEKGLATGLSDTELKEFVTKLEGYAGSPYLKLGARTGYKPLDDFLTKITRH